ncbi:MAG: cache domain-containing protein [Candidatus Marinimicrobia bacterium]|nr:cache domain-containing protein [Candidatus Neomarinimicrobiota bacterium]
MKKFNFLMIFIITLSMVFTTFLMGEDTTLTEAQKEAVALVNKAVDLIREKGETALVEINKPEGGFYIEEKALYAFVYDENCVMLAHPYKPSLVGKSYLGKPDIKGKKFRDEIVQKALTNGAGWTDYSYQKPNDPGIHQKTAYGKFIEKDGKKYIVVAGVYKEN